MRLCPEVVLIFIAMIAEKKLLRSIGDQDQGIMGKGPGELLELGLRRTRRGPARFPLFVAA